MEQAQLPRREREKLRQRREMMEAALELFSEKGYHNVSMHQIAARAEFAIGTLYKFFKNKEHLYQELLLDQAQKFHRVLCAALKEPEDEVEKLRSYVKAKCELFKENASLIRLYLTETQAARFHLMAGMDSRIRGLHSEVLEHLSGVFETGIHKGRFRQLAPPYHLAVALENLVHAFLLLWLEDPRENPYPQDPDSVLGILFRGLLEQPA